MDYLPSFNNKEFWEEELKRYVDCNAHSAGDNGNIWAYFKHCLQTQNRFFFQNALVPLIIDRYMQNIYMLSADTKLYRARIDKERTYEKQCWLAKDLFNAQKCKEEEQEKDTVDEIFLNFCNRRIESIRREPGYQEFLKRKEEGFEGYNAKESGAPPYHIVDGGRCNPEHVSFLYAANDKHTAVAEVRPFIRDSVSVATLKVKKELRLVDFYYEFDEQGIIVIKDLFMHELRSEFSFVNKGNKEDYLITQYLTLLAQNVGFDGIRFRSTLVQEGTNYVIFNNENCIPVTSKMYIIPKITYSLLPILDEE